MKHDNVFVTKKSVPFNEKVDMVQHWIVVCNQDRAERFDEAGLTKALRGASLATLCKQFGLNSSLVAPALEHLRLEIVPADIAPFYALHYQAGRRQPILIQRWDVSRVDGSAVLDSYLDKSQSQVLTAHLGVTRQIWGVAILHAHLRDIGLVLAYEIARWIAAQGRGIVRGLDGCWYRLNCYNAYVPLQPHAQDIP